MQKATRPFEYLCFFQAEFPTRNNGDVYVLIFVDAYSEFVIITGIEKDRSNKTILKHIRLLTQNKDFLKHKGTPFTLVLHRYEEISVEILQIIKPFKGKILLMMHLLQRKSLPYLKASLIRLQAKKNPINLS
jgi:hypothetical protein